MDANIGVEVGQKMRSAIKAKLTELDCYADDELPDYIMVMVANKRSRSQMKNDLQLFLKAKTAPFVEWLHIVLKKLKEITVNSSVVTKQKKYKPKLEENTVKTEHVLDSKYSTSLTDNLPLIRAPMRQNAIDEFDIPLLSEVKLSNEEELFDIEQRIDKVKTQIALEEKHSLSTYDNELVAKDKPSNGTEAPPSPRKSVHERLGKRKLPGCEAEPQAKRHRSPIVFDTGKSDHHRSPRKGSVKSRLEVQSKISIPNSIVNRTPSPRIQKEPDVASVVRIKPRTLTGLQPNGSLLLKAVAEAEKSITQHRKNNNRDPTLMVLSNQRNSSNLDEEYIPTPIMKASSVPEYVPTVRKSVLERLDKRVASPIIFERQPESELLESVSADHLLNGFATSLNTSDTLLNADSAAYTTHKIRERCRFWPNCRLGDQCEFIHPHKPCELFPDCLYGAKCMFLHPKCKFGLSCTRRECPYSHQTAVVSSKPVVCRFYPNCTNTMCHFHHPKPCKYGRYCRNQSECAFVHGHVNGQLSWRPPRQIVN